MYPPRAALLNEQKQRTKAKLSSTFALLFPPSYLADAVRFVEVGHRATDLVLGVLSDGVGDLDVAPLHDYLHTAERATRGVSTWGEQGQTQDGCES